MKTRLLFLVVLLFSVQYLHAATFSVTYNGFTPEAKTSFEYAVDIWANTISSTIPIKIAAHFQPLGPERAGITFPNGRKNFKGAPIQDTWYTTALANALTGKELNQGEVDMEIFFNSSISWYYGTTGTGNCSQLDFVTTALHEICHGLGQISLSKIEGTTGSIGMIQSSEFFPLTTSFPWPNQESLPSVFDLMLVNNLNQPLTTFTNPSTTLGLQLTSDNIYLTGTSTLLANNGNPVKIYAPNAFAQGSSLSHLDETLFPEGNENELMTPFIDFCSSNHNPGPLVKAILKDLGWEINITTDIIPTLQKTNQFVIYPNPFYDKLYIKSDSDSKDIEIILYDIVGKEILRENIAKKEVELFTDKIAHGCYSIKIVNGKQVENFKITKQ